MEMSGVFPRVRGGVSSGVCGREPPGMLGGGVEPVDGGGAPGTVKESGVLSASEATEKTSMLISDLEDNRPASDSPSTDRTSLTVEESDAGDMGNDSEG